MKKSYIKNQDQDFLGYYDSDEFRVAVAYRFPPNVDTRQKQLAAWCSPVLSCRLHKESSMTVMEAQESLLFNNIKLGRKLPVELIQIVLEELRKKGNLEWLHKNKSSFLIMWRRPEEWGKLVYRWVSRSGQNNSVFTLYELTSEEDTEDEEFHGLDEATLLRALQALPQEHRLRLSLSAMAEQSSSSSRDMSPLLLTSHLSRAFKRTQTSDPTD